MTTNLCVAVFRVTLVREPMQIARYPEEDFWRKGLQTGGDFQGVVPGWAVGQAERQAERMDPPPQPSFLLLSYKEGIQEGQDSRGARHGGPALCSSSILAKAGDCRWGH